MTPLYQAPAVVASQPEKPAETTAPTKQPTTSQKNAVAGSTTTGYGMLVGLLVQVVEIGIVIYLVVLAVSYGNVLAKEWVAPVIALTFAHNSLAPSQWGGGPPNS